MSDRFRPRYPAPAASPANYSASASPTVTTGTSAIAGLSHSFTATPDGIYMVLWSADVTINTTGTINITEALLGGTPFGPGINTGGAAGTRATGTQFAFIAGVSGAQTVTVQTRNAAGGSATVSATHTRLAVWRLS